MHSNSKCIAGQLFNSCWRSCWKIMWYSESVWECLRNKNSCLLMCFYVNHADLNVDHKLHACVITYLDIWPTAQVSTKFKTFRDLWPIINSLLIIHLHETLHSFNQRPNCSCHKIVTFFETFECSFLHQTMVTRHSSD